MVAHSPQNAPRRRGGAAVELAVCLPIMASILLGVWEVGRVVEVTQVMANSAREAARDASLGQDNLLAVANNLLTYLQGAEPTAFGAGHSTTMKAPVITLPSYTYGYTCWDNVANCELFTITFRDFTTSGVADPTAMTQLDRFEIGVQTPYATVGFLPTARITGITRLTATVDWVSMIDSPFQITPSLPAQ